MPASVRRRSETPQTYDLKWAAWRWLYEQAECRVIGFEVRLEGPSGRVADVVGVDRENRVYLVEVKASRSDLLKDDRTARDRLRLAESTKALADAAAFTAALLGSVKVSPVNGAEGAISPNSAASLVAEAHESLQKRLRAHEQRLESFSVKFHDPAYLRCADFHYLMAPHGLVWPHEMPPFWGLLNERGEVLSEAPPKQVRRVTAHILRNIAKANTRDLMKACGVEPRPEDGI
jgi:hypothetical protein